MSLIGLSITLIVALIFGFELLGALLVDRQLDGDVLVLLSLLFVSIFSSFLTRDRSTYRNLVTHSPSSTPLDFILSRLSFYSFILLCYFLTSLLLILLMRDTSLSGTFLIGALLSFFPLAFAPILRTLTSSR